MNITLIAEVLDVENGGGADKSLDRLARLLAERSHNVRVVTVNNGESNSGISNNTYDVVSFNSDGELPQLVYRVYKAMKKFEDSTDLFHIFFPGYIPIGGFYRMQHGQVPVIGRLNGYPFCTNFSCMDGECHSSCTLSKKLSHHPGGSKYSDLPKMIFDTYSFPKLLNKCDHLISQSPPVKNIYSNIGVDSGNISTVGNPYDTELGFSDSFSSPSDLPIKCVFVGRLAPHKGPMILLKSLSKLPEPAKSDILVDVYGSGEMRQKLESFANKTGVDEFTSFHGHVGNEELHKAYSEASVFVHPCLWPEPFGNTILESMQHNTVPIVSNVGAGPWVSGRSGIVFERGDINELRDILMDIIEGRTDLKGKMENCSNEVSRFEESVIIDKIVNIYNETLSV